MGRVLERSRADAGREAHLGVVRPGERLLVVLRAQHADHRPENLLAIDAHAGRRIGEKRRHHEIAGLALLIALHTVPSIRQAPALFLPDGAVVQVLRKLALIDYRTYVGALLPRT